MCVWIPAAEINDSFLYFKGSKQREKQTGRGEEEEESKKGVEEEMLRRRESG